MIKQTGQRMEDNEDVSLSRLKVNVRRQDSSIVKEVYLGKFRVYKDRDTFSF